MESATATPETQVQMAMPTAVTETIPAAEVAAVEVPAVSTITADTVVATTDDLNFRGELSLSSDIAAVLPARLTATVVAGPIAADAYTWYQLDVNGVTGWSAAEFLTPEITTLAFAAQIPAVALFPSGTAVSVADGPLNLRTEAGLTGEIQDEPAIGTAATILAGPTAADDYTWYQIAVNGVTGWSAGEFFAAASATTTTTVPTADAAAAGS